MNRTIATAAALLAVASLAIPASASASGPRHLPASCGGRAARATGRQSLAQAARRDKVPLSEVLSASYVCGPHGFPPWLRAYVNRGDLRAAMRAGTRFWPAAEIFPQRLPACSRPVRARHVSLAQAAAKHRVRLSAVVAATYLCTKFNWTPLMARYIQRGSLLALLPRHAVYFWRATFAHHRKRA